MTSTLRRVATLFMIFAVVTGGMAAFAGSAAATQHTTTLAGDDTDTVPDFNASDDKYLEYDLSSDGTDFSTDGTELAKMNVSLDGTDYAELETEIEDGTSATQTLNLSEGELDDLPGDAGETVTVDVTAWGTDGNGSVTTAETTFTVDITFQSSYAVATVDDSSADIEDQDAGWASTLSLGTLGDSDPADLHTYEQTVGVDGSNTTVTLNDATTNGSDAFEDAMEDKESGDLIYKASAGVNGTPVAAYYQSAGEDVEDGDTYAVYDADGNGEWTFTLGDDYSDASEVDLYVSSQSYTAGDTFEQADLNSLFISDLDMGLYSLGSNFGWTSLTSFSVTEAIGIGMVVPAGGLAAGLFAFGRPQIEA